MSIAPPYGAMIRLLLLPALTVLSLFAWNQDEQPNVNSRYTVESVHLSGKRATRLSQTTRRELEQVVGQRLDHSLLDDIATRIKRELRVEKVAVRVAKGTQPERVTVEFTVEGGRRQNFDLEMPKGVFVSRQGWSGGVNATTSFAGNRVGFGVISDGDSQVERFAGLRASWERSLPEVERLKVRFDVETYHLWNRQETASSHFAPQLYRARENYQPSITYQVAEPLSVTAGISIGRLEASAGGITTTTAVIGTVRFHKQVKEGTVDTNYSVRAATSVLGSELAYTRHLWSMDYRTGHGPHAIAVAFTAGRVNGTAPVYENFVLGNSTTLRGYNKYDLDPLGGDRMVHSSVDYSYRKLQVFYDAGSIKLAHAYNSGARQSAGIGFGRAGRDGFLIALAFPLRGGHIDPMLLAGFNF